MFGVGPRRFEKQRVSSRVIEAPLECDAQHDPNSPAVFPLQRHLNALRSACVSSQFTKGKTHKMENKKNIDMFENLKNEKL